MELLAVRRISPQRVRPQLSVPVLAAAFLGAAPAAVPAELPRPPAEHLERLAEAFHLVETAGPSVWPGFELPDAPVLLVVDETEYALNLEGAPAGWDELSEVEFAGRPVFARPRQLPPHLLASYPALGRPTVVVGTPEATERRPAHWVLSVGHELFHVFLDEHGIQDKVAALEIGPRDEGQWQLDHPFPYGDEDVLAAMHLAGYALFRTVTLPSDAPDAEVTYEATVAHEALRNLLLLLDLKHDDPRHARYLRFQTGVEGVARYVERALARAAAAEGYRPLDTFLAREGEGAYRELWDDVYANMMFTVKHLGRVARSRLEFYAFGLGLAEVLDRLGAEWKRPLMEEPGVWLDDLLARALGEPPRGRFDRLLDPRSVVEGAARGAPRPDSYRGPVVARKHAPGRGGMLGMRRVRTPPHNRIGQPTVRLGETG